MVTRIKAESRSSIIRGAQWIIFLSFFDALVTHIGIRQQLIEEVNPFAKLLFEAHVVIFYAYKIGLPLILLAMLPYLNKKALIRRLIYITIIIYALLALYHVGWILLALV